MPLHVVFKEPGHPELLYADFSARLQNVGSDYHVYTNRGYTPQDGETELLQAVLRNLINDDHSGVKQVDVQPYRLTIWRSLAVSVDDIRLRVLATIRRQGVTPVSTQR